MKIEKARIESIRLNEANPRTIKDDRYAALLASIRDFPEMLKIRPIVVNEKMEVLGGNMRLRACIEAGMDTVYIIRASELSEEQQRRFIVVDNVGFGEWNWDVLANEWDAESVADWGLDIPDFEMKGSATEEEATEDDYEIPETIKTDIARGDLFEIGLHRLLCGDSTNADDVARLTNGVDINLIITDPPYGVSYVGKTKDALEIQNDSMSEEQTHQLWRDSLSAVWPCLKPGGSIYATVPAGPLHIGFAQALKDFDALRQIMVWNKDSMVLGRSDYHYKHEPILYGWKPGAAHYFTDDRTQTSVFDVPRPKANREHPTMKPVELWARFMQNSSVKSGAVYDPFLGSGTTMVAAHQLNRRCYGMEIDEKYCQVIVDRMLKLDPTLEIKRNGVPYKSTQIVSA